MIKHDMITIVLWLLLMSETVALCLAVWLKWLDRMLNYRWKAISSISLTNGSADSTARRSNQVTKNANLLFNGI